MNKIPVLTIKQPWLYAIMYLNKRIENRSWHFPSKLIGKQIALHSSKSIDFQGIEYIEQKLGLDIGPEAYVDTGKILAYATIDDSFYIMNNLKSSVLPVEQLKWIKGRYLWVLNNVEILNRPINAQGRQRIWYYDKAGIIPRKQ